MKSACLGHYLVTVGRTLDDTSEEGKNTETDGRGIVEEHPVLYGPEHRKSVLRPSFSTTWDTSPILDNIHPTWEKSPAQGSSNKIEDVDGHAT